MMEEEFITDRHTSCASLSCTARVSCWSRAFCLLLRSSGRTHEALLHTDTFKEQTRMKPKEERESEEKWGGPSHVECLIQVRTWMAVCKQLTIGLRASR